MPAESTQKKLDRVRRHGIVLDWLTFDEGYGKSPGMIAGLEQRQQRFVGEVPRTFSCLAAVKSGRRPEQGKGRHYYHLYGLERVGTLGLFEKIGDHYWYKEGAQVLLRDQRPDGAWNNQDEIAPTDLLDTCYALLFLRRGTAPVGDVITPRTEPRPSSP